MKWDKNPPPKAGKMVVPGRNGEFVVEPNANPRPAIELVTGGSPIKGIAAQDHLLSLAAGRGMADRRGSAPDRLMSQVTGEPMLKVRGAARVPEAVKHSGPQTNRTRAAASAALTEG